MVDQAAEVTYRTVLRRCHDLLFWAKQMGYDSRSNVGLTLKNDQYVSYHKSRYRGRRCYYVCHSGIEYIWAEEE